MRLICTTTQSQNEPGSNSNERVLHTSKNLKTEALPLDAVSCHTQDTRRERERERERPKGFKSIYLEFVIGNKLDYWVLVRINLG